MRHLQLRCMCRSWQSSFKRPLVCSTQPVGCWGVKTCHEINMLHFARCAPLYTFCGRTIVPLDTRWIDESCWITDDKIIICIRLWGLKQGLILCFEHVRISFICFLCSFIHSPPRFIHVPSAFIRFQTLWTGSYFHLFSSFFQTHLLKISFLNVPSAISRRSQFVLVPISVSIYVRPISGHHHHTIQWFDYPWLSSGFGAVRTGAMGKELQSDLTNISNQ